MSRLAFVSLNIVVWFACLVHGYERDQSLVVNPETLDLETLAIEMRLPQKSVTVLRPEVKRLPLPNVRPLLSDHPYPVALISDARLEHASKIAAIQRAARHYFSSGDTVVVAPLTRAAANQWAVYRPLHHFADSRSSMTALRRIAFAKRSVVCADCVTLLQVEQEVRALDIVLPLDFPLLPAGTTQPVDLLPNAMILGSLDGYQYIAAKQWLVLDKGSLDGMRPLARYDVKDPAANSPSVGQVQVVYVYPTMSLAQVVASERPLTAQHVWPLERAAP